jgi:NAD(P)-dependent dehydrogenase (short-subunit alcohol dehydrogenase family)
MDLGLTGRRALVTGGSRGIGRGIARALALEGADVALVGRHRDALERAARAISAESSTRLVAAPADTADAEATERMFDALRADFGEPDILVNAAATPSTYPGLGDDDLEQEIAVKVRGYLRLARLVAPGMIDRGWGRIINVGGLNSRRAGSLVGSVRNVAVTAMSHNLADELGPHGINVVSLHPGWTRTEQGDERVAQLAAASGLSVEQITRDRTATISLGRMVTTEEVADVAAFLASPRGVAINGDAIHVGGGIKGFIYY